MAVLIITNSLTSMVTLRKKFLKTFQIQGVRILIWEYMWIKIMSKISKFLDQGQGYLSTLIWIWSSGYPRINRQLKRQFLVWSLWWWSMERKHSKAFVKRWGRWEFRIMGLHTSMATICKLSPILTIHSLLQEKIVTIFLSWNEGERCDGGFIDDSHSNKW